MTRKARYIPRNSRDSATFDETYQTLGSAFGAPVILFKIVNDSDVNVDISTNAVDDHDIVPAGSFTLYDLRSNKGVEDMFSMSSGTQFYVKGAASTGSVYLIAIREQE